MIEDVEELRVESQVESFGELGFLEGVEIEAGLEIGSENVAPRRPIPGFEGVSCGYSHLPCRNQGNSEGCCVHQGGSLARRLIARRTLRNVLSAACRLPR